MSVFGFAIYRHTVTGKLAFGDLDGVMQGPRGAPRPSEGYAIAAVYSCADTKEPTAADVPDMLPVADVTACHASR